MIADVIVAIKLVTQSTKLKRTFEQTKQWVISWHWLADDAIVVMDVCLHTTKQLIVSTTATYNKSTVIVKTWQLLNYYCRLQCTLQIYLEQQTSAYQTSVHI